MSTTTLNPTVATATTEVQTGSRFFDWENIEFNRFGIIAICLALAECLGGIAAACALEMHIGVLAVTAFPTTITLGFILAVAPMKQIIRLTALALVIDVIVFVSYWLV